MSELIVTNKRNCSTIIPSSCTSWSGFNLKNFDLTSVNCMLSVDDIILNIDDLLFKVSESTKTDDLTKQCLTVEDSTKLNSYVKALVKGYCQLKSDFDTLKSDFNNLNIFTKELTIDINCVTGSNNCGTGNVHTLASLIKTLYDELCVIKNQIN